MLDFDFEPLVLPQWAPALREEVRAFLAHERAAGTWAPGVGGWARYNARFSEALGRRGWLGMTWPREYGGHERSALERHVVTEELLVAGAPSRAHWTADRQVGPLVLAFGSEQQKRHFLPRMAAGRCGIALGLSEPNAGSDLANISTAAVEVEGGWRVNGRKLWSSHAHVSDYLSTLLRTAPKSEGRHGGVSRLLIDLKAPGVTIRPVVDMMHEHSLNEVTFDDVFVPHLNVVGEPGGAWRQLVDSELTLERATPDRWTALYGLFRVLVDEVDDGSDAVAQEAAGRMVAQLWTLQQMSLSVAGSLAQGRNPSVESSLVKDLATNFEQELPRFAEDIVTPERLAMESPDSELAQWMRYGRLLAPALTIKGGTREILRNNIARGLGLR